MKGLLFLALASLVAPMVLWQHSCRISIASKLNLPLLDVFELSPLLTTPSPLSFSAVCVIKLLLMWHHSFPVLFTGVSVGVSADILTMLLVQRLRENVFPIDVVCLLLWSHTGETPIQKSPPWWIGLRLESMLLIPQPFADQKGMMEPLQRESTIFIYLHTSVWNLWKCWHRTTLWSYYWDSPPRVTWCLPQGRKGDQAPSLNLVLILVLISTFGSCFFPKMVTLQSTVLSMIIIRKLSILLLITLESEMKCNYFPNWWDTFWSK